MKKNFLLFLICFATFYACAQTSVKTVNKKNWLTENVREKYSVLKSDDSTREGLYSAIYSPSGAVIAAGNYHDGKKTGTWHFYDIYQRLVEVFDYDHQILLNEEPMNRVSLQHIRYLFDQKFSDTDRVTKPIRIGGRCFGYIPYLQPFRLSRDYYDVDERLLNAELELLISPGGRLADLKVHIIASDNTERITTFSPDIFSEEDKQFIPATINGEPVMVRIFLMCRVTYSGGLDVF